MHVGIWSRWWVGRVGWVVGKWVSDKVGFWGWRGKGRVRTALCWPTSAATSSSGGGWWWRMVVADGGGGGVAGGGRGRSFGV